MLTKKLLNDSIKSITGAISKGFDGIEHQLDRDLKIKEHNNKQLMDFQETVNSYNDRLHKLLLKKHYVSANKETDSRISMYKLNSRIKHVKTNLITYISLWSINVTHGIITKNVVYKSLGVLISDEYLTLENDFDDIKRNAGCHYADAINCIKLYNLCGNTDTYEHLKARDVGTSHKGGNK